MVALLRMPSAHLAGRIGFSGPHAVEHRTGRPTPAAGHADDVAHRAVHLDDAHRSCPRGLVQSVDVLRHQRAQLAAPLERDQRPMTGIRRCQAGWSARPATTTFDPRDPACIREYWTSARPWIASPARPAGRESRGCRIRSRCPRRSAPRSTSPHPPIRPTPPPRPSTRARARAKGRTGPPRRPRGGGGGGVGGGARSFSQAKKRTNARRLNVVWGGRGWCRAAPGSAIRARRAPRAASPRRTPGPRPRAHARERLQMLRQRDANHCSV